MSEEGGREGVSKRASEQVGGLVSEEGGRVKKERKGEMEEREEGEKQEERERGENMAYTLKEYSYVGVICFLGNRPHPSATDPPFPDSDPRRRFALKSCDPRVHFALVCGAVVGGHEPVFLRDQ